MGSLCEKVAVVTGGGRGIGRATSLRFAQEGANVAVVDVVGELAEHTAGEILHCGGRSLPFRADVAEASEIDKFVEKTLEEWGKIDILVNNAGIGGSRACLVTSEESWDHMISVNLKSVFLVCKRVIPEMVKLGKGKIINIASIFGIGGAPGTAAYSAAKSGVINFTRQLAVDYSRYHININSISPGLIETEMTQHKLTSPESRERLLAFIPLGRFGAPSEVAAAALFLASEESNFITGHNLVVDGGQTARVE